MSNAKVTTFLICFHFNTYCNFKHYYICNKDWGCQFVEKQVRLPIMLSGKLHFEFALEPLCQDGVGNRDAAFLDFNKLFVD